MVSIEGSTGKQCDGAWVDAIFWVDTVMHCTWLQFRAPLASQAPPPMFISVDEFKATVYYNKKAK